MAGGRDIQDKQTRLKNKTHISLDSKKDKSTYSHMFYSIMLCKVFELQIGNTEKTYVNRENKTCVKFSSVKYT